MTLDLKIFFFFADDLHRPDLQSQMKTYQQDNWWETQERVAEVVSTDELADVGPRVRCHCQVSSNNIVQRGCDNFK